MSNAVAIVLGASISGVVGVLVVVVQQWIVQRHQRSLAQAKRLARLAGTAWSLTIALGRIARAPIDDKTSNETREDLSSQVDQFNFVMAQVQLLESGYVLQSANDLDAELRNLVAAARSRHYTTREEWRSERQALDRAVDNYRSAARSALGRPAR